MGGDWDTTRELVLRRDGRRCTVCGEARNLHVHHRIPRHLGGPDAPWNLITLCAGCHAAYHPLLQVKLARRLMTWWAVRLARWLSSIQMLPKDTDRLLLGLRVLGLDQFREGQLPVMLAALRRESLLAVMPTGSGKSACFQVPALLQPGTSYVISPLKALMHDQVAGLQRRQIPATFINSDLDLEEKHLRYELLEQGALKMLYLAPERLDPGEVRDPAEVARLFQHRPDYLVVDEAHCVDRWGDDFRPSYGRLAQVRQMLGNPPLLAFTATAGREAQKRVLASLGIPNAQVFLVGVDRPNIGLIRHETRSDVERYPIIANLIHHARVLKGKALVFVPTKRIGEQVRAGLAEYGLDVPFYHGGLSALERQDLLDRFRGTIEPPLDALVCTNAFGMGIDIPNIRVVVHWLQPESVEDYLQEFGRAGRDGKPAVAVIFKAPDDLGLRRYMARKTAEKAASEGRDAEAVLNRKLASIDALDRMIRNRECFRQQILAYFGSAPTDPPHPFIRLFAWLTSERQRVQRAGFCCDACDPQMADQILRGARLPRHLAQPVPREAGTPSTQSRGTERPKRTHPLTIVIGCVLALAVLAVGANSCGDVIRGQAPALPIFKEQTAACDPSYPTICIPPPPPDLDCTDIPQRRFTVLAPDPHNLDQDGDGIGCEGM